MMNAVEGIGYIILALVMMISLGTVCIFLGYPIANKLKQRKKTGVEI